MADAVKAFNTEKYDASDNPRGFQIIVPSSLQNSDVGVFAGTAYASTTANPTSTPAWYGTTAQQTLNGSTPDILYSTTGQSTGSPTASNFPSTGNIDPLTNIRVRIYRVDDPTDANKGWLPDVEYMRYADSNNTQLNSGGDTQVTDASRFVSTAFFVFRKKNKNTNEIIEYIPATVTAISQSFVNLNAAPTYIDLNFNMKPVNNVQTATSWNADDGQLERDSSLKYEFYLETNLPAKYYDGEGTSIAT